jgi:6-phosphofructokinase
VIGGDDTLGYATKLNELGVKIVAIPKTMDNDVRNTEYCIGFSTAITRASDAMQRQRTTVASHERIGILRMLLGRLIRVRAHTQNRRATSQLNSAI